MPFFKTRSCAKKRKPPLLKHDLVQKKRKPSLDKTRPCAQKRKYSLDKTASCVKTRKPSLNVISQHNFEIGSPTSSKKWISTGAGEHKNVTVKKDENTENWIVEREDTTPFWSFHILSKDGKKLYVSYDDSNAITLEEKDADGKKRLFEILMQQSMSLALRVPSDGKTEQPARYVQYIPTTENEEVGKLAMVKSTDKKLLESMKWLIKEDFGALDILEQHYNVEIQNNSQKWISSSARSDQPVTVGQTGGVEKWRMVSLPKSGVMSFSVYTEPTEPPLFASCEQRQSFVESDDKVMFYADASADPKIRKYEPRWGGFTCKLLNMSSKDWVGISSVTDSPTLELKDARAAADWNLSPSPTRFFTYKIFE